MRLVAVWIHLLGVVAWVGGVLYQSHVLLPVARSGGVEVVVSAARRARRVTWTAVALVVLTGFYNVTRLGPLERVMETGAGVLLAGKFLLVLLAIAVAGQRDFAQLPRLRAAVAVGDDPAGVLATIAWLDRIVLALAAVIIYLGLAVSRS